MILINLEDVSKYPAVIRSIKLTRVPLANEVLIEYDEEGRKSSYKVTFVSLFINPEKNDPHGIVNVVEQR